jgi:hypothetical protein
MAREMREVWVVVPPKMTGDIQWPIQVHREEQVARWACEEHVRVGVASKVERLPLLTPHDAAVLEAAEALEFAFRDPSDPWGYSVDAKQDELLQTVRALRAVRGEPCR